MRLGEAAAGPEQRVPRGWRYGTALNWYVGERGGSWLPFSSGGDWKDPTQTKALFNSPACVAACRWIANLFHQKVAIPRSGPWRLGMGCVALAGAGGACMAMAGGWTTVEAIRASRGIHWNS